MPQDRKFGILILAICVPLFIETLYFPTRLYVPLGVAFWPRLLLGCLTAIAVFLIIRGSLDAGPFDKLNPKAFAAVGIAMVYVVLLDAIGYLLLTPVFLFVGSCILAGKIDRKQIVTATIVAVLGTSITYFVFHDGLYVQLPEGLLY